MKTKLLIVFAILLLSGVNVLAQNGGKAEPNRITFAKGKSSAVKTGKIYGDVQAEYVFGASQGQTVTIRISSVPKGNYSAFQVLNAADFAEFASEQDVNYSYSFTAPYTGDYLIWVKFRPAGAVKQANYTLTLGIK